jgi:hypothetical protein
VVGGEGASEVYAEEALLHNDEGERLQGREHKKDHPEVATACRPRNTLHAHGAGTPAYTDSWGCSVSRRIGSWRTRMPVAW